MRDTWKIVKALAKLPSADGVNVRWVVDGVEDFDSFALYEMPEQFKIIPADARDILIQMRGDTLAAEGYDLRSEYNRVCKENGIEPIPAEITNNDEDFYKIKIQISCQ